MLLDFQTQKEEFTPFSLEDVEKFAQELIECILAATYVAKLCHHPMFHLT